ncbi:ParB/RepB/Spo0J family partition protein [Patescibacteria group bacterium]|nr:ParB/RepB/Spo0J family partition protein [Patescibacteria group bacterium]MBU1721630.1 ParB/RepB/Spo0J family partition protein [Patescibacteria group bacterium]MBU1901708.1 ParB/RepB/Spo0J family partition protein [Patescibacteria group bacterium]
MALGKGLNSLIPQQKVITTSSPVATQTSVSVPNTDRIWHVPLSEIVPNPHQPRKQFSPSDLEDLVTSIQKHGIMQPINVTERVDGGYELIAGERRFRAAQLAKLATIPAIVRQATEQEKLELALIENIQRQKLNPIEEAFAYKRLIDEFGLRQQDVAEQVGKSRPVIANTIRLLDLPDEIQRALIEGSLKMGQARALLSLKSEREQIALFQSMMGQKISVREVEKQVAAHGEKSRKGSVRRDPNLIAQEQLIEERLGAKVRISKKGDKGTIVIVYHSKDELRRLLEELS